MRTSWYLLVFIALFYAQLCFPQSGRQIDSLKKLLSASSSDTSRVNLLCALVRKSYFANPDSAARWASQAHDLAVRIDNPLFMAKAFGAKAAVYYGKQQFDEALDYYFKSVEEYDKAGAKGAMADVMANIGVTYYNQSNIPKALEWDYKTLELYEQLKNEKGQALVLGNIGIIHYVNSNFDKALEFISRAMAIDERLGNAASVGRHLGNIGSIYVEQGDALKKKGDKAGYEQNYNKALEVYLKALDIVEKNGDKSLMAINIGNIANIYFDRGDTAKSLQYNRQAYKLYEELGNKEGMSRNLGNIGWAYQTAGNFKEAEYYTKKAIEVLEGAENLPLLIKWHSNLSGLYEETGKPELALKHYKLSTLLRDSLFNIENARKQMEAELSFEVKKKEALAKEESARHAFVRNALIAGFVLMLIIAVIVFRGYRNKKKANDIISSQKAEMERQKILVETKNKEITDSIQYARRIQKSLMPSERNIERSLKSAKHGNS